MAPQLPRGQPEAAAGKGMDSREASTSASISQGADGLEGTSELLKSRGAVHGKRPESLLNHRPLGPPLVSDSADLGRGPRICISHTFQVMLMLLVWEPHFENH